jgi:hypothetical protein
MDLAHAWIGSGSFNRGKVTGAVFSGASVFGSFTCGMLPFWRTRSRTGGAIAISRPQTTVAIVGRWPCSPAVKVGTIIITRSRVARAMGCGGSKSIRPTPSFAPSKRLGWSAELCMPQHVPWRRGVPAGRRKEQKTEARSGYSRIPGRASRCSGRRPRYWFLEDFKFLGTAAVC